MTWSYVFFPHFIDRDDSILLHFALQHIDQARSFALTPLKAPAPAPAPAHPNIERKKIEERRTVPMSDVRQD